MTQVLRTIRRLPKETLSYEAFLGLDGQGKPNYDTPVSFDANVLDYDPATGGQSQGHQFVNQGDGSKVRIPLTLYVAGDAANVPSEKDRVTSGASTFIVLERVTVSGLRYTRANPNHFRLRCKQEGA